MPTVPIVGCSGPSRVVASLSTDRRDEPRWKGMEWFPIDQGTRTVEMLPPAST
jgi:hypothetical protein